MSTKQKIPADVEQQVQSALKSADSAVPDPPLVRPTNDVQQDQQIASSTSAVPVEDHTSNQTDAHSDVVPDTRPSADSSTTPDPHQPVITTVYCYKCDDICDPECGRFF